MTNNRPLIMVDDSPTDITITKLHYRKTDSPYPFQSFPCGKTFLNYMERVAAGKEEFPAVVLLDLNMPGINGFDTLKQLRDHGNFREYPCVVVYTNSDHPSDREKAYQLGANGFQTKPHKIADFRNFFCNSLDQYCFGVDESIEKNTSD